MACFRFNLLKSLKTRRINRKRISNRELNQDDEIEAPPSPPATAAAMSCDGKLKRFRWEELKKGAKDFSKMIGSGGLSNVYLANLYDSNLVAVKIIQCGCSERLSRIFRQELEILRQIRHENIVNLIGFSESQDEGALILEYVPNGTLQEKLHSNRRGGSSSSLLSWKDRMVIAFQVAGAMQYLHERCSLHIVHGDIKSSNILLDERLNSKLCDFGSAKMGFSSMVLPPSSADRRIMMGSPGYVDPQFLRTGIASKKSDVYSFGVVLLELITGMEAFCPEKEQMLTSVAGADEGKVVEMVDPRLKGNFDLEEVKVMATLAGLCLRSSPSLRPSAADLLFIMSDKIAPVYNSLSCVGKQESGEVCHENL
ncbi:probable receptor-like protein kinase At1g33260 [Impatiens glandulifera]|uniref:probable receptor-like protein kinase At1g33260 n=1 Tax=Impatiens glandulifera TaxID=253017 RepID=UPI001FB19E8E|nr:probable receptor-like protein kinase At1g33260 [Impatiens glandulifera]